ncbi:efflux RND transporter permease subunit [Flagellimonas sp.]|uniref:efflux RND transporter permease subunit n=1 Tax=Flagellimonas sp. TaxID=2058762 RepID=UPI003B5056D5
MKFRFSSFSKILFFGCLSIIGICLIPLLNIQLTSDRSSPALDIDFRWPGASARVIEQEVTLKLEGVLNSMLEVKEIHSLSKKDKGHLFVSFKKDSDVDALRFQVANLIRQVYPEFPLGVEYPKISINTVQQSHESILSYSVQSNQSPVYIKKYIDNYILPKLTQIKGVSKIDLFGIPPYEYVINYDYDKLAHLQIDARAVGRAIVNFIEINELGIGFHELPKNNETHDIAIKLKYRQGVNFDWQSIPILHLGQRVVLLGDIAKIKFKESPVNAYYRVNGLNTVSLVIYPEKGANTITLARKIKDRIEQLTIKLENGYHIELINDPTVFLIDELNKIKLRTLFSLFILFILMAAVYRNIKYLLVLFIAIISNLLIAIILFYFFDIQLQLYSFAGITISFGIVIDNAIIIIDHLRNKGNKKAFLAILAATFTTIGSILIVFLLEEKQRHNLWDFALVIIINLGTSLMVSYHLVPALMQEAHLFEKKNKFSRRWKRKVSRFTSFYILLLSFLNKKWIKHGLVIILLFAFGIPLNLAPEKLNGDTLLSRIYNNTIGNKWFTSDVRPFAEKFFGGSLRLFTEDVFDNSYFPEPGRTALIITGKMPEGCTIQQLNDAIKKMEQYILPFNEVELFESIITDYNKSIVNIYFKPEYEFGLFPNTLKGYLEGRSISLGGVNWTISGVGRGFSNALMTDIKSERIIIEGYNYEKLYEYAQKMHKELLKKSRGRIKDCVISSGETDFNPLNEFHLNFDTRLLAEKDLSISEIYDELYNILFSLKLEKIIEHDGFYQIRLESDLAEDIELWELKNTSLNIRNGTYRLKELGTIQKKRTGNSIRKINQKYVLQLEYDFLGPPTLAKNFRDELIKEFSKTLAIGYTILNDKNDARWKKEDNKQYYYLLIIIVIIFFICAILLESLIQPIIIILMVPISFIGIFLTFYHLELNFDQGGYACFVLISGITVNSSIYIINDYNNLKKQNLNKSNWKTYFKAFNQKIIAILLTIISTIAGLIPFILGKENEVFWFAFAIGSIGGLCFSLIGLFLFLPLLMTRAKNTSDT